MPGLRHLQLFGNRMTITGLMAILNNCLHLEYLDLRQCCGLCTILEDEPEFETKLRQQIKHVRFPQDSTEDYEFDDTVYDSDDHIVGEAQRVLLEQVKRKMHDAKRKSVVVNGASKQAIQEEEKEVGDYKESLEKRSRDLKREMDSNPTEVLSEGSIFGSSKSKAFHNLFDHIFSHSELIDRGRSLLKSVSNYGIFPDVDHVTCVVDMLGRGGYIKEAKEVANLYLGKDSMKISSGEPVFGACPHIAIPRWEQN
ncbi:hypothetical protein POM88_026940 [Heracleum sosnowskyi]|uniref:Uncharacterized protein n=1 Tax=Heracleum sosnowskyi TaxID=360622 RepID=A0AAD8I6Z0_9APIA|nr:hypothetical protein POM88_026940 [Heracleum sosnowskyi]